LNINQSDLFGDIHEDDGQLGTDGSKLPPIDHFISGRGKALTPSTPSIHTQLHSTLYKGDAKRELLSSSSTGGGSGTDSARGSCSSARSCSSSSYSPDELSSSPAMHCSPVLYPSSILSSTADCLPEVLAERSHLHLQPPLDAPSPVEDDHWTMAGGTKIGLGLLHSSNRSSGTNQLGRTYSPGLPLSMLEREQIVELYKTGWKICDISKTLCIT